MRADVRKTAALLLALTMLCIAGPARAEREVLRIAIFNVPPYGLTTPNGQPVGLYVDVLQRVAKLAGYTPTVHVEPFARVHSDLKNNIADVTISFPTPETTDTLIPLGPVFTTDVILVPRKPFAPHTRADIGNMRIGRLRGGCIDLAMDGSNRSFAELNNFADGIRMLAAGRIDGVCTSPVVLAYYLRQEGLSAETFGKPLVLNRRDSLLYLRPGASPDMQRRLREGLAALQRGKVLEQLIQAYLP